METTVRGTGNLAGPCSCQNQTDNKSLLFDTARTEMHIDFGRVLFSFYPEQSRVSFFLSKNKDWQYYPWV